MSVVCLGKKKESAKEKEFEDCVVCHEKTSVPKNMHIESRENYVYGAGQLCPKCAKN